MDAAQFHTHAFFGTVTYDVLERRPDNGRDWANTIRARSSGQGMTEELRTDITGYSATPIRLKIMKRC